MENDTNLPNNINLPIGLSPKDTSVYILGKKNSVKDNASLSIDDIFCILHNSIDNAVNSLTILRSGGGYTELRNAGFKDNESLRDCAIFYSQVDIGKYHKELALKKITRDTKSLNDFLNYLNESGKPLPNIGELVKSIRTNYDLFNDLLEWFNIHEPF